MDLNVYKFHCDGNKRWYLRHPFRFIKDFFRARRAAKRRAKYGFDNGDVWNMDDWFCAIIPEMLRKLADDGCAYPGSGKFDTPEKWHDWLHSMADLFDAINVDPDEENEFSKEFYGTKRNDIKYQEIRELYLERMKEIDKEKKAMRASAMKAFSEGIVEGLFWD